MNVRIRYQAVEGTPMLKSRRVFKTAAGQDVTVELDTTTMKYTVRDAASGAVIATDGKTKNLSVLKIQAKQALEALGISFGSEKRNR